MLPRVGYRLGSRSLPHPDPVSDAKISPSRPAQWEGGVFQPQQISDSAICSKETVAGRKRLLNGWSESSPAALLSEVAEKRDTSTMATHLYAPTCQIGPKMTCQPKVIILIAKDHLRYTWQICEFSLNDSLFNCVCAAGTSF